MSFSAKQSTYCPSASDFSQVATWSIRGVVTSPESTDKSNELAPSQCLPEAHPPGHCPSESLSTIPISTPIHHIRSCSSAANGHVAPPPAASKKSCRLMFYPEEMLSCHR